MDKQEIAAKLEEIGTLLELAGENPFKARAYFNAARTVAALSEDPTVLVREGRLGDIRGIGDTLARQITAMVTTGHSAYYEELKAALPPGLTELLKIPGLGPKKVKVLADKLGVKSLADLELACMENRLLDLPGFGQKTQEKICQGIAYVRRFHGRFLYADVFFTAKQLLAKLQACPAVIRAEIGGSLRRRKAIIKDIDLLASADDAKAVMDCFTALPEVRSVTAAGETKTSVVLDSGVAADLRVVKDREFPYALHHITGSKEHNTALRQRARQMGLKINEYGLFRGEELIECEDEPAFFRALGLDYIPPELREDMGEIAAAQQHALPRLVQEADLRGVFHIHTRYSDGVASIPEMIAAARDIGLEYIGIADHSQSAAYARGLKWPVVLRQMAEIDELNAAMPGFTVFKGIEADILPDGSLDYPDELLSRFDFVIASVHSHFRMGEAEMTRRVIKAITNNYVTMLGHPTGRLLLSRDGYALDVKAVIDAAAETGTVIEINANPHRLDLDWHHCKYAKERGVKFSINPDAHSPQELAYVYYGVGVARKGWLERGDCINTMDRMAVGRFLREVKGRAR